MPQPDRDSGFTLIEVLVTITLMGVMMAIAVSGWSAWSQASAHSGTAREIQSVLRQAQQQAVTEGTSICVQFSESANSYSVLRGSCDGSLTAIRGPMTPDGNQVSISSPTFSTASPSGVTFYARGTATAGTVKVVRSGSSKVYTLKVEGLTGRVQLS